MTFVILTAGIDLSVGSILAFSGAVCASLLSIGLPLFSVVFLTLFVGAALGAANGFTISYFNIQPFIATLVGMTAIRGATLLFSDGRPISTGNEGVADDFYQIGASYFFGIPSPVIIATIVLALAWYVLKHTKFGGYVYAIGGNESAAMRAGINVKKSLVIVYSVCGASAALAGLILVSRLESAQPTAGTAYELDAIAAVVLGGTSLLGGKGRVVGTVIGALIIGVINNSLNLLDVSSYYQMIAKASVILLAVIADKQEKRPSV